MPLNKKAKPNSSSIGLQFLGRIDLKKSSKADFVIFNFSASLCIYIYYKLN